jgi:hypothetical protein
MFGARPIFRCYNSGMFCSEILERWRETGYDPISGVNPPPNLPAPLPPHQHEQGYDDRCGLCNYFQELSQEQGRSR